MDKSFNKTMFFAVAAIAFISLASMYFVTNTGSYWSNWYKPKDGMCYCHKGIGTYTSATTHTTNCLAGIKGKGTKEVGFTTHNNCIETCGQNNYWWCSR